MRRVLLSLILVLIACHAHAQGFGGFGFGSGGGGGSGGSGSGANIGAIDTSTGNVTVGNTTTETTLYTFTLPADTIGTAQCVEQDVLGTLTTSGSETVTFRGKYGAETVTLALAPSAITAEQMTLALVVCGDGATGAQVATLSVSFGSATSERKAIDTIAIDSTANQALAITAEWATADAGLTLTKQYGHVISTGQANALIKPGAAGIVKATGTGTTTTVASPGVDYVTPAGNVATATALAADGTDAAAGNAIRGVDAQGNATGEFDVATQSELNDGLSLKQPIDDELTTLAGKTISGTGALIPLLESGGTSGHCVQLKAGGGIESAGAACGTGGGGGVTSFNSRTGAVSPASGDYNAGQVTNTPAGDISASTAQAAINELDTEKASLATLATDDGTINQAGDLVSWNKLKDVPAGFADGTDDGGGGGGVSDGDKGDVTISGSGSIYTIDNDVVTNAKAANMANSTIKCRNTAGTGDPEDCTAAQVAALLPSPIVKNNQANTFTAGQQKITSAVSEATAFEVGDGTDALLIWGEGGVLNMKSKVAQDLINNVPDTKVWRLQENGTDFFTFSESGGTGTLAAAANSAIDNAAAAITKPCRTAAGASPTVSGQCAYDSTSNTVEFGVNGANKTVAFTDALASYLPKSAGSGEALTGQLFVDNLGLEFEESDTNPTCASGNYAIYADTSEAKFKKCTNGTVSDLDTNTGGGGGGLSARFTWACTSASGTAIEYPLVTNNRSSGCSSSGTAGTGQSNAHRDNIYVTPFEATGVILKCFSAGGNVASAQTVDYYIKTASAFGASPTLSATSPSATCQMAAGTNECNADITFGSPLAANTPFVLQWVKSAGTAIGGATWYMDCQAIFYQ